jgi:hypothetical protein
MKKGLWVEPSVIILPHAKIQPGFKPELVLNVYWCQFFGLLRERIHLELNIDLPLCQNNLVTHHSVPLFGYRDEPINLVWVTCWSF